MTVVSSPPATTCALVTTSVGETKKPLPTTWPSPQPVLAMRAVLAIADSASARVSASAGRSTGGAGAGSKPAKRGGSPVVSSNAMSWPATIVGGGSRSPAMRSATDSRAAERQARSHPGREHAADEPDQESDVCHADDRAAHRVERSQAALPEAVAHRRAAGGTDCLADDHERAEADHGRDRPHRLLDDRQLVAEHRRQQQRQAEPDGGADEAEHRPEEAGSSAGDQADDEQREDARIDEVHGPPSLAASAEIRRRTIIGSGVEYRLPSRLQCEPIRFCGG